MNKETLQSYNNELGQNNADLDAILETINNLPEAEPNVQAKSIEITENGTITVTPDADYDGLSSVEITTNVASSGGETPETGYIIDVDSSGYPTKLQMLGISSISKYAFANSTNTNVLMKTSKLQTVKIGDGLTSIGNYAFYLCTSLQAIELPDSVTTIGEGSFNNCTLLELNKLPNSLISIGVASFEMCYALTIKTIPDSTISIAGSAFNACKALKQISMKNVTTIGSNAFNISNGVLKTVWIGGTIEDANFSNYAFSNTSTIKKIFIDLQRTAVETFTGYSSKWGATNATIICNDDEGFMAKDEFDAIDWSTYTG